MNLTKTDNQSYLHKLWQQGDRRLSVIQDERLKALRQKASQHLQNLPLPTKRDEEWLFTDLSDLVTVDFEAANLIALEKPVLEPFILEEATQTRLTFVNGIYAAELSDLTGLPDGIYVGNLQNLPPAKLASLFNYLDQQEGSEEIFTTLNTSSLGDIAIIWVEDKTEIEIPIHCLFLSVVS
ncbi:MAG: Fe-S cluster assembly protein SufD, partial [Microcystaceae cyanobacterium]